MNMLGIIQSQKTAELLLDLKVSAIVSSPKVASVETANVISCIQEAADCLGADCVPRYVELKQLQDLDVESILQQSKKDATEVPCLQSAVGHPVAHIALMRHCLNLTKEWMGSFHLDAGSISVIDFPDGSAGRGVIRCINYTAHLGRWSIPITRSVPDDEAF
ncbi:hypothetical protein Vadar_002050 [Vaccinium darrowii]|uniref:Uncharacterized protein n=1 Tax=Vaccinium darrowii TaxID=229202 RepID=A0ACB7Y4T1_9ERIC|nr:hypothetical protein Vadar_002050 [Vaccinium darrowii]